jgi:riboflavin-specific deaminase-like protein
LGRYADCLDAIRDAAPGAPFVVAQLGQSLDGRIALPSGESRWINGPAALRHVHQLRASVDAVLVGIGTALADDPLLNVRHIEGRNPARVILDPRGRARPDLKCLRSDGSRRIVILGAGRTAACSLPTGVETLSVPVQGDSVAPMDVVDALARGGLRRILVEGGARTVSGFVDAGAVDRLHLLVAPVILGSGTTGLDLKPIGTLAKALRFRTDIHVLDSGDVLFDCDLRKRLLETETS